MRTKRRLYTLGGIILAISIGVAVVYLLIGRPAEEAGPKLQDDIPLAAAPAEIQQLEAALNSRNIATQSKALAPGLDVRYRQQARNPFAPGVTIAFDYASYRQGDGCAKVEATLSTGGIYLVHLVEQNNQWFIWHTEKGRNEGKSC